MIQIGFWCKLLKPSLRCTYEGSQNRSRTTSLQSLNLGSLPLKAMTWRCRFNCKCNPIPLTRVGTRAQSDLARLTHYPILLRLSSISAVHTIAGKEMWESNTDEPHRHMTLWGVWSLLVAGTGSPASRDTQIEPEAILPFLGINYVEGVGRIQYIIGYVGVRRG